MDGWADGWVDGQMFQVYKQNIQGGQNIDCSSHNQSLNAAHLHILTYDRLFL